MHCVWNAKQQRQSYWLAGEHLEAEEPDFPSGTGGDQNRVKGE